MQELIERLRALLNEVGGVTVKNYDRIRGCHDIILAMEERVATIRACRGVSGVRLGDDEEIEPLLERA